MAGYYCLVASLNEYLLEGDSKSLDFSAIRQEIEESLSARDLRALKLLLTYYDIQNLLGAMDGRTNQFSEMGNYSREQIAVLSEIFSAAAPIDPESEKEEEENTHDIELSGIFAAALRAIQEPTFAQKKSIDPTEGVSRLLFSLYYRELDRSKVGFLRRWSQFDRDVKNIAAAFEARKKGVDPAGVIVGEGEVCEILRDNAKEPDFGLGDIGFVDEIVKILATADILKKERGLDLLRWRKVEELNTFRYFDIDFLLGYVVKLTMINRWLVLDEKTGREMFSAIVGRITNASLLEEKEV